jgi:hypothetical protein
MAMTVGDVVRGLRGSYRIEARHGEGAFGVAYRAVEESSGARLIVKELRIERLEDWKALELFEREGRVLAGLAQRVQSAAAVVSMLDAPPPRSWRLRSYAVAGLAAAAGLLVAGFALRDRTRPQESLPTPLVTPAEQAPAPPERPMEGQMNQPRRGNQRIQGYRPPESLTAAPDSMEGRLRAQGKSWILAPADIHPGDYVEDILRGRLDQPAGRGTIGKVVSVTGNELPTAAVVDFGRGYAVGIFTTELSRIQFVTPPSTPTGPMQPLDTSGR